MQFKTNVEIIENGAVGTIGGKRKYNLSKEAAINLPVTHALDEATKHAKPGDKFDITVTVTKKK